MKRGPIYVFTCYVIWGICPIYWKLFKSVDPYFILSNRVVWSFVLSAILVLALFGRKRFIEPLRNRREVIKLFIAGAFCVANWGIYIIAVNTDHIVDASLAYFMNPIMAIVIGAFFFHEHLVPLQWAGVALATIGVAISILSFGQVPWMALLIGGTFAIYGAIQKTCESNGIIALALEMTMYALPLLIFAGYLSRTDHLGTLSGWQWLGLPTMGIITAVPLLFFARGISETDYSLTGILMYINPTLQLLVGVLLYGEPVSDAQKWTFLFVWLGLILYLTSVLMKRRHEKRRRAQMPLE